MDGFSLFMLIGHRPRRRCASGLYSIDYMNHYGSKANYYALLLMMVAGMNGLVLVTDLFQVYLFLEVAAVASYALVAFGLEHDELEAAFKYLDALGRRLGRHPDRDRHPLRHDRQPELRRAWPRASAALDPSWPSWRLARRCSSWASGSRPP